MCVVRLRHVRAEPQPTLCMVPASAKTISSNPTVRSNAYVGRCVRRISLFRFRPYPKGLVSRRIYSYLSHDSLQWRTAAAFSSYGYLLQRLGLATHLQLPQPPFSAVEDGRRLLIVRIKLEFRVALPTSIFISANESYNEAETESQAQLAPAKRREDTELQV